MRPLSLVAALVVLYVSILPSVAEDRVPVPKADAQADAGKIIRDLFKEEYAKKKPAEMLDLAEKLRKQAEETKDDPTSRFVLYREARDLAARAGDISLAMAMVDTLAKEYAIANVAELRASALTLAGQSATAQNGKEMAEFALVGVTEAIAADDYELADRLAKIGQSAAVKAKTVSLTTTVNARAAEVEAIKKEFDATRKDVDTLKKKADDPEANLRVGKFLCFYRGDWDKGLPLLARGSDAKFKALAKKDLDIPVAAADQVEVADAWYTGGDDQMEAVAKTELKLRALYWYKEAEGSATGLTRTRIEKRVGELEKLAERRAQKSDWLVIFRSDDPAIWDKDVAKGRNNQSTSLKKVPENIKYLKLTETKNNDFVIVPMTRDRLVKYSDDGKYGWEGRSHLAYNARHLGIYSKEIVELDNSLTIFYPGFEHYGGWGFGNRYGKGDEQGYTWKGKPVAKTVFEISVKKHDLSASEAKKLLKK